MIKYIGGEEIANRKSTSSVQIGDWHSLGDTSGHLDAVQYEFNWNNNNFGASAGFFNFVCSIIHYCFFFST